MHGTVHQENFSQRIAHSMVGGVNKHYMKDCNFRKAALQA